MLPRLNEAKVRKFISKVVFLYRQRLFDRKIKPLKSKKLKKKKEQKNKAKQREKKNRTHIPCLRTFSEQNIEDVFKWLQKMVTKDFSKLT